MSAPDKPRVCIEMQVPSRLMLDAAERAVEEDPQNASAGQISVARRPGLDPAAIERFGALLTGKRWRNGRRLLIRHLDGDAAIHAKVERYAKVWEQFANLKLDFGEYHESQIRISYRLDDQSWSYVGTDALSVSQDEHTMHFGWLKPETEDSEVERVVVHEFGHALGLIHEHQHPEHKINWDKEAVYDYYCNTLKWTRAQVDHNLFAAQAARETQFSQYDAASIMHYPVPPQFTLDRKAVGWNKKPSEADKTFIAKIYPKAQPAMSMPPPSAVHIAADSVDTITRRWG